MEILTLMNGGVWRGHTIPPQIMGDQPRLILAPLLRVDRGAAEQCVIPVKNNHLCQGCGMVSGMNHPQ